MNRSEEVISRLNCPLRLENLPHEVYLIISEHLSISDHGCLIKTSKYFCSIYTDEMYRKDIPTNSSIRHSVCIQKSDKVACQVIQTSVSLGSNVNCLFSFPSFGCTATALHIAAARDRTAVVRELINQGADANARGSHLQGFLKAMEISYNDLDDFLSSTESPYFDFLPLFTPFYLQYTVVVTQLIDYGAEATLLIHPRNTRSSLTVFHLYAKNIDLYNKYGRLPKASGIVINQVMPKLNSLPLTMAVQHPAEASERLIDDLISHGAKVNLPDSIGDTPLRLAISRGFFTQYEKQRQKYKRIFDVLLQNGADVNQVAPTREDSTPLLLIVLLLTSADSPTPTQTSFARHVIKRLEFHRVDLNRESTTSGDTAFNIIYMHSAGKSDQDHSARLAKWLWKKGANINMPDRNNISLLGRYISLKKINVVKDLLQRGARVTSIESHVLASFLFNNPQARALGIEALADCQHFITQREVNSLYFKAWKSKSKGDQKWLKDRSMRPAIPFMNKLIGYCFQVQQIRLAKMDLDVAFGFQVNSLHSSGCTYMHLVAEKVATQEKYTDKHALEDGQFLIDAGINLLVKDSHGNTAAERLKADRVGGALRLLLWDTMNDQERKISLTNKENKEESLPSTEACLVS